MYTRFIFLRNIAMELDRFGRERRRNREERERKAKKLVELLDGRLTHKSDFLLPAEAAPQIASHNDERI